MRDYDPTTGRYIQADPLGLVDGPSVYNYALQNPGRHVDPRGESVGVGIRIAVGVGGRIVARKAAKKLAEQVAKAARSTSKSVPWPEKNRRNWTCICRAHKDGRSEKNCPTGPDFGWGSATHPNLSVADKAAREQARKNLGAVSTHHTQCKCTGPNGEQPKSGDGVK
jgi:uncharacterized protein RhaS with RHS repeats